MSRGSFTVSQALADAPEQPCALQTSRKRARQEDQQASAAPSVQDALVSKHRVRACDWGSCPCAGVGR